MTRTLSAFGILLALATPVYSQVAAPSLTIGQPAPALTVEAWLKGSPIPAFEKGQVYVVEFWATWCGPCRASIPHLSELQAKYQDKGLRVVGVNVFEKYDVGTQAKVKTFVDGFGPRMNYTVAYDGKDGRMAKAYMTAADQHGIPTAFIVDRQGLVTYIGYPMAMDQALAQVLDGTFTLAMGKAELAQGEAERQQMMAEQKKLEPVGAYLKLLSLKDYDKAFEAGRAILAGDLKDNPAALNAIAWSMVDPRMTLLKPDLEMAFKAGLHACEVTGFKEPGILDTLARVYYLRGDKAKAIETQKKAIGLAPAGETEELEASLKEYQAGN